MSGKIQGMLNQAKANENESSLSSAEETFSDSLEAERIFSVLKTKLQNIGEWNDHAMLSSYELYNKDGTAQETETLSVGSFIRILLRGSGKYDWVRIIDMHEVTDEFVITVKPTFDPTEENPDPAVVSHFFTDAATNNFCLSNKNKIVSFYVIGLNEKQNTSETDNALQTIRNVAVNLGSYLGIQTSEWEKFCHGFLQCAMDEAGQTAESLKT